MGLGFGLDDGEISINEVWVEVMVWVIEERNRWMKFGFGWTRAIG